MDPGDLELVPIHKCPEYMKECCSLINEEWPRSETARMSTLKSSCDNLPTSLILIRNKIEVIGHCKLTRLHALPYCVFLESVVISKDLRGRKLGTYLMNKTERYCRNVLKLRTVYLSTKGQQNFYEKLGYKVCEPVHIYGTLPMRIVDNFFPNDEMILRDVPKWRGPVKPGAIPPPPPPPMPSNDPLQTNPVQTNKTYMCKDL